MSELPTAMRQFAHTMPVIDPGFPHGQLLAATAAVRITSAKSNDLSTDRVREVLAPTFFSDPIHQCPYPGAEATHLRQINEARYRVRRNLPERQHALDLPLNFYVLPPDLGESASCPSWPQQVAFCEDVLADPSRLEESYLHELCHQWHYLLQHFVEHEVPGFPRDLVLPSGTANRSAAEVLGALHVSSALTQWYGNLRRADDRSWFQWYGTGCVEVLRMNQRRLTREALCALDYLSASLETTD